MSRFGFWMCYGCTQTDSCAMYLGISLGAELNFDNVLFETDSAELTNMVDFRNKALLNGVYFFLMSRPTWFVTLIQRETNELMDALARFPYHNRHSWFKLDCCH